MIIHCSPPVSALSWPRQGVASATVRLDTLNLDVVLFQRIADLARRQSENAGRLGLDPARLLHCLDETVTVGYLAAFPRCRSGSRHNYVRLTLTCRYVRRRLRR